MARRLRDLLARHPGAWFQLTFERDGEVVRTNVDEEVRALVEAAEEGGKR